MPFIPHTTEDISAMLAAIGAASIDDLFTEIPLELRNVDLSAIPAGLSEMELCRLMRERAALQPEQSCFIGAGAYDHHIPAAVWDVATRGEWMTAYTPYQAEASQGSLQLIYEYQTMMASLMGLAVSNASLYEGASALAEAVLMGMRLVSPRSLAVSSPLTVLLPQTIHPAYREVVQTIAGQHAMTLIDVPYDKKTGRITIAALESCAGTAQILIIPQPNFFGVLEETDVLTRWAKQKNRLVIGVVNPLTMAWLKPPGQWGETGVDIACGEGQPLGIPLSCGGPYYGFLCCKQEHVRQMPGRIAGRTTDREGKEGFVLTLQAREQHIRRAKATSNICTNQGLMVTASTIYMSLMGPQGLRKVAAVSHQHAKALQVLLTTLPGVEKVFAAPFFHEFVIRVPRSADAVLKALAKHQIQGGFNLQSVYPELGECLLVCATETKTVRDLEQYSDALQESLHAHI